ncbi:hypothetical protein [Nocardioides sambongensis]|nr:hypothetical protein [Nocardioides sambongensis]
MAADTPTGTTNASTTSGAPARPAGLTPDFLDSLVARVPGRAATPGS